MRNGRVIKGRLSDSPDSIPGNDSRNRQRSGSVLHYEQLGGACLDDATETEIGNIVEASNLIDRAIDLLTAVYEGSVEEKVDNELTR